LGIWAELLHVGDAIEGRSMISGDVYGEELNIPIISWEYNWRGHLESFVLVLTLVVMYSESLSLSQLIDVAVFLFNQANVELL